MKIHTGLSRRLTFFLALFPALAVLAIVASLRSVGASSSDSTAATYSHGILRVAIPYRVAHAGAGQLTVEILDPDDKALGRSEQRVDVAAGKGMWREEVQLTKPLSIDDLVWNRLRYRYAPDDAKDAPIEDIASISEILRTPVVHILGDNSYLAGGSAAVRVIVTDSKNDVISGASALRIELRPAGQKTRVLFTGALNKRGTAEAQFRFPAGLVGTVPLVYDVDTPLGSTEYTQQVRLEDKVSVLLTTEKPIYQPGQTIHVRALALDRANHAAAAGRNMTFEVEDSRGNKVFKKAAQSDKFGIASAEFALADEVNLGTYHLRALMDAGEGAHTNTAEVAVNVERYVLPKFKVAVDFGGQGNKAKRGYRPGDHVTGTARANYFFGKPVDDAEINVKASSMDVAVFEAASVDGKTDRDGAYHFDLKLPSYFAGKPLSQGAARVLIEATVKDSAGHSETRGEPITVSESPLLITAVPEAGKLVPDLDNQIFILTSYPDGTPAKSDIRVRTKGNPDQRATTDAGGVAIIHIKAGDGADNLRVEANDNEGNHASTSVRLKTRNGADQILLRTERAVYRAGDRIQLRVFATKNRGAAYVDVVKDGQTILTRDLDIVNGQATLDLTATPAMAGTLDFNAYLFGRDAMPVADHRLVFVQPADDLKIEATADAPVYKPGGDARVRFRVTNSRGEGVQAAIGLQVVDEAVFALAEKQPGFAKVFFYLEQEVMKPRYEIHSIGMSEVVAPVEKANVDQRDRAARALFSATEMVNTNRFETKVGGEAPRTKYLDYMTRYRTRFVAQVRALPASYVISPPNALPRDAWGTPLHTGGYWQEHYYVVRSAGPDKKLDSPDDLTAVVEIRKRKIPTSGRLQGIQVNIEHDRGPFNGRAEITGFVTDQTGAAVLDAQIEAREISTGRIRTDHTDAAGQFRLVAIPAGEYAVKVSSAGVQVAAGKLSLAARDRAALSVKVRVALSDVVVSVPIQIAQINEDVLPAPPLGGVVGGVPGGIPMRQFDAGRLMAPKSIPRAVAIATGNLDAMKKESAAAAPHIRSYFPEALYINPEIITDGNGLASISIPLADSITTWRMALMASTTRGALGSATSSLKVFQDFFTDLDLPVTLTQGDRISIPVAVYNYSGSRGDVCLELKPEPWFSLVEDVPTKTLAVDPGRVGGSQFTIQANRIGKFKFTLAARMGGEANRADIVVREIEVVPNGRQQNVVFNGRIENAVHHEIDFPAASIPDASKVFVRLYPGPLSQVIEGMDAILRMPFGCFEQTSSATYPNVLALDYMKRTKKLTPEVHAKAEGFIANGYQRLLTFEVPGGGFSWFGSAPANKILTAYGLMEFYDMSQVHDVDPNLIQRTQQWLAAQQQPDGSWKPDTSFINEGATNRFNRDVLRITAYIAWSLENTGYRGPAVERAQRFVATHMDGQIGTNKMDSYTLAVLANFAVDYGRDREFTRQAMNLLLDARTEKGDQAWWTADETGVYSTGASASVETTALAVQALLKWGEASGTTRKALAYVAANKDANGTWGTTQATIMALRALLLSTEKGSADVRGTIEVTLNGKPVEKLTLTPENNDLLHQFVFKSADLKDANAIDIRFTGKGGLAYQVVGAYFLPWTERQGNEPLSIAVNYDRTHLAQDDIATATATVKNNLPKAANMVMVDLGIPPGFDLLSEDLQDYQEKSAARKSGRLEKFNQTATQAILYFDSIAPGDAVTLRYRLRAKYPIRARTFASRVYEYYSPEISATAHPVQLVVSKR